MAVMALPMSRTHLPGRLLRLREGGRERKRIEQERETGTGRQRGRERQREAEGDRERQIEREKKRHRQRQRTETETGLGRADRNRQRRRRRRAGAHSLSIHTPGARPGLQLRLSAVLGEAGTGGESQRDTHTHAHTHTHARACAPAKVPSGWTWGFDQALSLWEPQGSTDATKGAEEAQPPIAESGWWNHPQLRTASLDVAWHTASPCRIWCQNTTSSDRSEKKIFQGTPSTCSYGPYIHRNR